MHDGAEEEPVAIVGMACRFPSAEDPAALWRLLCSGRDAMREVPADRWDVRAYYDANPARPGKTATRQGGFLDNLDQFDAAFFGISPREAAHVDPRQRLILELGWEALEDAGIPPHSLAGSATGVFVATLIEEYNIRAFYVAPSRIGAYSVTGCANSILANRLSYVLDLHGLSMALDSACSGSLMAIHLACASLRRGESTLAMAGGASVIA